MIRIPEFPKTCIGILWDYSHPATFIAYDKSVCVTYSFVRHSIRGKYVEKVGLTYLISDQIPVMLYDGDLCLHGGNGGKLTSIILDTHVNKPGIDIREQLKTTKALRKFNEAWELCNLIGDNEAWRELGMSAISDLNVNFALRVFRQIGDAGMVFALEDIAQIEDVNLLAGFCALILDQIDEAKALFAKSSNPLEALDLCRDLLQWEQAIALGNALAPDQMPFLAREYAQQLEFTGNFAEALMNYEKGLKSEALNGNGDDHLDWESIGQHVNLCKSGIARYN